MCCCFCTARLWTVYWRCFNTYFTFYCQSIGFIFMSHEVWYTQLQKIKKHTRNVTMYFTFTHPPIWTAALTVTVGADCTNCCSTSKQKECNRLTTTWNYLRPQAVCTKNAIHQAVMLTSFSSEILTHTVRSMTSSLQNIILYTATVQEDMKAWIKPFGWFRSGQSSRGVNLNTSGILEFCQTDHRPQEHHRYLYVTV